MPCVSRWTFLPIPVFCGSMKQPTTCRPPPPPGRRISPMPNSTRLDLDRFMPYRLSVLTNRVSSAIARHYSQRFSLSIPEWRVMAVLGQTPGLSAREVAERTAMDKVQVSRAVQSLLAARRLTKLAHARDGRVAHL